MSPANWGISQDCTSAQNPSFESQVTVVESLILNSVMAADVIAPPGEQPAKHTESVPVAVASVDLHVSVPRLTGVCWYAPPKGPLHLH